MSRTHTSDGRRLSSMTHARRAHTCELCGHVGFGNGAETSHGRAHVRRGEAVELVKYYGPPVGTGRVFLAPDDPRVAEFHARGYEEEQ
jgi:hypothetical protein